MTIHLNDKLLYLAAGFGLGAVIGALFAPRSGQEIRRNLSNKVGGLAVRVPERIQHSSVGEAANKTLRNVVEKSRNVASIGRQRLNDSIEAGKRKFNESIEEDEDTMSR
ncbi:MAG TPA: YtxH domain-containing protein [Terriglobia bacterium]|nr:YtxH domain-containing protein [Terriglobia bacterium]